MADHLGEPPSTVQSWKSTGRVPATRQPDVLAKAEELGLPVTAEDVIFPLGRPLTAGEPAAGPVVHCTRCHEHVGAAEATTCASEHCPMRVARLEAEAA